MLQIKYITDKISVSPEQCFKMLLKRMMLKSFFQVSDGRIFKSITKVTLLTFDF